jgi:predicted exporter
MRPAGGPPATFSCSNMISVLDYLMLIGMTVDIVIQYQMFAIIGVDLSFLERLYFHQKIGF